MSSERRVQVERVQDRCTPQPDLPTVGPYDCYETKRLLMNLKLTPPRYRELSPMELNGKKTPGGAGTHKGHTAHTDAYRVPGKEPVSVSLWSAAERGVGRGLVEDGARLRDSFRS